MSTRKTAFMILLVIYIMPLIYAEVEIENVLDCKIFPKNSIPDGYDPILGVMSNTLDESTGEVINAHVSELGDNIATGNYDYVVACNTKGYLKLSGYILDGTQECDPTTGEIYMIDVSDLANAHVESPYYTSSDGNEYFLQVCIKIEDVIEGVSVMAYCDVRDESGCFINEDCVFKFSGKMPEGGIVDSNAHIYSCEAETLPLEHKTLCCRAALTSEGEAIIDISTPAIGEEGLIVQVGLNSQVLTNFFNPSSKPTSVTLTLKSTSDPEGKIFENFIWFEGENVALPTREITLNLNPYERDSIIINIFGGKVGTYELIVSRKTDTGEEVEVFRTPVTIVPASTQGFVEESPEMSIIYMFLLLIVASYLVYRRSISLF